MAIVRNHSKHLAERIERELADWRAAGERAVTLEVQREIHRVQAPVQQRHVPVARACRVERRDVVADVMSDDHAVLQVVEKAFERLGFLDTF